MINGGGLNVGVVSGTKGFFQNSESRKYVRENYSYLGKILIGHGFKFKFPISTVAVVMFVMQHEYIMHIHP